MTSENLLLSVVTPVYNGASMIDRSYWCLRSQTFSNWEWVVVDDGSKDSTRQILNKIAADDPRVRVIAYDRNRGRGYARTKLLEHARSDWIALWDIDDFYMPDRLERVQQARLRGFDYYTSCSVVLDLGLNFMGIRGRGYALKPIDVPILIHAATAAKRGLLRQIGYRPDLRTVGQIGEDAAVVYKLSLNPNGFYDSEPTFIHVVGNEVFLKKSVHSNRIQLQVLRSMWQSGEIGAPKAEYRKMMRRRATRLMMLHALQVAPPMYGWISSIRRKGAYGSLSDLPAPRAEYLRQVQQRFSSGAAATR